MPVPQASPAGTPGTPGGNPWKVELAPVGAKDDVFGGCRSIEGTYVRKEQIGEGTYGQVLLVRIHLNTNSASSLTRPSRGGD